MVGLGLACARPDRRVLVVTGDGEMLMGLGAVAFYSHSPYLALLEDRVTLNPDVVVFSLLFAAFGSALPEELLFRGYLMGSLNGRAGVFLVDMG